jgi:hypothetical protein
MPIVRLKRLPDASRRPRYDPPQLKRSQFSGADARAMRDAGLDIYSVYSGNRFVGDFLARSEADAIARAKATNFHALVPYSRRRFYATGHNLGDYY